MHYLLLALGMVLSTVSVWLIIKRLKLIKFGVRTIGQVVGHEKSETEDSISYRPVFMFIDEKGVQRKIISQSGWSAPRPDVGTKIKVIYSKSDSEKACIDSFYHIWFWALVLSCVSMALLIFA